MKHITLITLLTLLTACTASTDIPTDEHASMTMDAMNDSLEGKMGDAFDKAFIEAMIEHHEGAIDMALQAEEFAEHVEIRQMAGDIIEAQQAEINQMNRWYEEWGYAD